MKLMTKNKKNFKTQFCYKTKAGNIYIAADQLGICGLSVVDFGFSEKETTIIKEAAKQLEEYLDGKRIVFDIPLNPSGTDFQAKVWAELRKVPYGETRTYKDIALAIGNPNASRAVGSANNKNPILIFTPCHRIIGSNGSLTGFAAGINLKQKLINLEQTKRF